MNPKKGEITYYHESGNCLKVEVLDYQVKYRDNMISYEHRLKVLELVLLNPELPADYHPKIGQEFVVFLVRDMSVGLYYFSDKCEYQDW